MKIRMTIIYVLIAMLSNGQSLSNEQLTEGMQHIKLHLQKAEKQYRTGTVISIVGAIVAGAAIAAPGDDATAKNGLAAVGGVTAFAGWLVANGAWKQIGKAGRWEFEGTTIKYNVNRR